MPNARYVLLRQIALLVGLVGSLSAAPPPSGVLAGLITNPSGEAVRKLKITLVDVHSGIRQAAVTDDEGFFSFSLLPPGEYRIEAPPGSFAPRTPAVIVLGSGEKRSWRLVWDSPFARHDDTLER